MTVTNSNPFRLNVVAGSSFVPPYAVPTVSGQVLPIGTRGQLNSIKPLGTISQWHYALFDYYGGGAFNEDYSEAGAWTVAGSGGHNVPGLNVGGVAFDFTTAEWVLHTAAHTGAAPQTADWTNAQLTGIVITGSVPDCPAPSHQYAKQQTMTTAQGGGPRGSYVSLKPANAGSDGFTHGNAWKFNWDTNLWSPAAVNDLVPPPSSFPCRDSFYDPPSNRWYLVPTNTVYNSLYYLDPSTSSWTRDTFTTTTNVSRLHCLYNEQRRLIIQMNAAAGTAIGIDLTNTTAYQPITLANANLLYANTECQWVFYPPDGCYYHTRGSPTLNQNILHKLTPPVFVPGDPFAGTWTVSHFPLTGGGILPGCEPNHYGDGVTHHNRLFYVPSLQLLCWIPGAPTNTTSDQVFLVKP